MAGYHSQGCRRRQTFPNCKLDSASMAPTPGALDMTNMVIKYKCKTFDLVVELEINRLRGDFETDTYLRKKSVVSMRSTLNKSYPNVQFPRTGRASGTRLAASLATSGHVITDLSNCDIDEEKIRTFPAMISIHAHCSV
jgi:hypothetical protein